MAMETVATATLRCSFGTAPTVLSVTSGVTVLTSGLTSGTILDYAPLANVPSFALCQSLANPSVAAATAAAMGTLTPMPCVPNCPAPWVPGSPTVLVCGSPALNDSSNLTCSWGGLIEISLTPNSTVQLP